FVMHAEGIEELEPKAMAQLDAIDHKFGIEERPLYEREPYYQQSAVREMVSSPLTFIKKVASQLVSFWVLGGNRAKTVAFALMQIPVLGIAAGGMRVQLRSQPRAVFGVAAVGCYLIGVYSMSLAVCRYSMPLRPWMLL